VVRTYLGRPPVEKPNKLAKIVSIVTGVSAEFARDGQAGQPLLPVGPWKEDCSLQR
jgi:hypothetical protein